MSNPVTKGKGKTYRWIIAHIDYSGDDCLQWPFSKDRRVGRGMFAHEGIYYWAHRFMCEAVHGPAPADKPQAAHTCGNGHKGRDQRLKGRPVPNGES